MHYLRITTVSHELLKYRFIRAFHYKEIMIITPPFFGILPPIPFTINSSQLPLSLLLLKHVLQIISIYSLTFHHMLKSL